MSDALDGLSATDVEARVEALSRLSKLDRSTARSIGGLCDAVVVRLTDPEAVVRQAALEAITALAHGGSITLDERAIGTIIQRTRDADGPVRAEAAVALAVADEPAGPASVDALIALLSDKEAPVRREAAAALGDTGAARASGALRSHLEDEDEDTSFEAAFALASLGDATGLNLLVTALDTARRRFDACEAMRRLNSPEAVPALQALSGKFLLGWPERLTVWATLYALGDTSAGAQVIARTGAWSRQERAMALGLIGSHKIKEGRDLLVDRTRRGKLRDAAVRALGDLGDRETEPVLVAIAEDNQLSDDLRADAVRALAKLPNGQPAVDRLKSSVCEAVAAAANAG